MDKHLIVVSVDAMVYEDLEYCKTLPNFSKILKTASVVERVRTIYPSLTHPVHATLISGNPAGKTGIVNNMQFCPEQINDKPIWYNALGDIRCETILHVAKRAGMRVATSSWPLNTQGQDVIDYLIPNAFDEDFVGNEDNPLETYKRLGAGENVLPIIQEGIKMFGYENKHPEVDDFQTFCAAEIIKKFKPNLLLTHPGYVDSKRHSCGVFGDDIKVALQKTDEWLGILLSAVQEAGIEDSTDFIILSDHGQINITRSISPNVYLADRGYIQTDEKGKITKWRAFSQSAGASAQVYLENPLDKQLHDEVYALLLDMAKEGIYGFERVYTVEETKEKYGLYGGFSFVLETDGYTSFGEWCVRPAVRGFDLTDYRFGRGTHGHEPEKGPQPPFIGVGKSFKKGVVLPNGSILNHAPTMAAVLGLELKESVGKPVYAILNVGEKI